MFELHIPDLYDVKEWLEIRVEKKLPNLPFPEGLGVTDRKVTHPKSGYN
jgi:disulfide oxidoreductase YuzD